MNRIIIIGGVMGILSACGLPDMPQLESLSAKQPRVVEMAPTDGQFVSAGKVITLQFSHAIDKTTVSPQSVLLISNWQANTTAAQLMKDVVSGNVKGVPSELSVTDDLKELQLKPLDPAVTGTLGVVVTPALQSADHVPFNQTPGMASSPYMATLVITDAVDATATTYSTVSSGITGEGTETGGSASAAAASPKPSTYVKPTAMPLVINELVYDLPGDDTNGDLFVELRGTPGGDVGGYKISFINGDDGKETEHVTIPAGLSVPGNGLFVIADGITGDLQHTHVANADFLDNFDPQNGPDSVQLISPEGKLVDAVSYGTPKLTIGADGLAMLEGLAAPDAPMSKSISRLPDAEDTNDNSVDFVINEKPSPGDYDVQEAL